MTNNQISSLDCVYCSYTNFTLCIYSDSGRAKETRKFNSKITQPTPRVPLVLMQTGSNSEGDSLGWQTDLENLMLGPDGQLCDACERPQQLLYSPSEAADNTFHLCDNTKDDLPAALWVDVNMMRPKQITSCWNPLEIFEEQKLMARNKAESTSKNQPAINAYLKRPQMHLPSLDSRWTASSCHNSGLRIRMQPHQEHLLTWSHQPQRWSQSRIYMYPKNVAGSIKRIHILSEPKLAQQWHQNPSPALNRQLTYLVRAMEKDPQMLAWNLAI